MYTGNILRSAQIDTIFEGRVPAVVLDLSKEFHKLVRDQPQLKSKAVMRESMQRYFDGLLWSQEKEEWNLRMDESEKTTFVDIFYNKLMESDVHDFTPTAKEFKVKNTIECDMFNEQLAVTYNAYRRTKQNVNLFTTVTEDSWLDLDEVIDAQGINIVDELDENEKREIIDMCWTDADELIQLNQRK